MASWTELQKRFRELEEPMRFARLDHQSGTEGEYWRVAAFSDPVTRSRFETLSKIAGRKLVEAFGRDALPEELRDAPTDEFRWYRSLGRNMRFYSPSGFGHVLNDKNERVGWVGGGHINNPAAVSAAHCLELAAMTREEENIAAPLTINLSGDNARLNVASVDNSTNVVNSSDQGVFLALQKAILEQVATERREHLLAQVEELRKAVNEPSYLEKYKNFMQSAADHVTVLGPYLPALASFLR